MNLQYPIGHFEPSEFSEIKKEEWLADIKFLPNNLENTLANLDEHQLHTPYREGGWTINQLVHHIADSHMNAYMRFKLGYTEECPTIKTYEEKLWAETADVKDLPVNISITLLFALHKRWYHFLKNFTAADWQKNIYHPERKKNISLWELLGTYAWHGRHHVAHISSLKERMSW